MNSLKEIIDNDQISNNYFNILENVEKIMNERKKLHEINNLLDLELCVEKMHEAKINLDYCLKIIEFIKIKLTESLNIDKENFKFSKIENDVYFAETFKQLKEDLTAKDFERKKELFLLKKFKKENDSIEEESTNLNIINFELKSLERLRENIDDVYLSLKKKYDAFIKFKI